jgi:PAS domain-containing protein
MPLLNNIWRWLILCGVQPTDSRLQRKQISFVNGLWAIALLAYIIFFIIVLTLKPAYQSELWISNVIMVSTFIIIRYLITSTQIFASKVLLLGCIYGGIFFYDSYLGAEAGVFLYYFAFIVAGITLFSWKDEKPSLIALLFVPLLLFFITRTYPDLIHIDSKLSEAFIKKLYHFNFGMAFIVLAVYVVIVINSNRFMEEQLSQSGINLQTLLDNTTANIWSINTNYELIAYNSSFKNAIRHFYSKDVKEGFNLREELMPLPNYSPYLKEVYAKALSGIPSSGEFVTDNTRFELLARPLYDAKGKVIGATFYDRDITDRTRKDIQMRLMGINLQTLIDNMPGSIWSIDKNYKVITANRLFMVDMQTLFGVTLEVGADFRPLIDSADFPDLFKQHQQKVLSGEELYETYTYDNTFYEIYGKPLKDESE